MDIQEIQAAQRTARTGTGSGAATSSSAVFSKTLKNASVQGPASMDDMFTRASETYGVPVNLLKAVAKAESSFQPDVTSKCGAMGVMQLMPGTAKSLGVTDPYDAEQNIMGGAKYLSSMLDKYDGNTSLALAAYNAGSGAVQKYGGIPPYPETQNYVKRVLGYAGQDLGTVGTVPKRSGVSSATFSDLGLGDVSSVGELLCALIHQEGTTTPQEAAQIYNVLRPMVQSQLTGNFARGLFSDENDSTDSTDPLRYFQL